MLVKDDESGSAIDWARDFLHFVNTLDEFPDTMLRE
jgi:hypothetical protein